MLLLLGLVLGVLTPGATSPASATDAAPTRAGLSVPLRVGSYNIRAGETQAEFERGVEELRPLVDVAGLQEIAQRSKILYLQDSATWGTYSAPQLTQNPVLWDRTRLTFVDGRGALLAEGRSVGDEKPGAGDYRKDSYATVVRLRHRATGQPLVVINVHLLSGAISGGRPRADRPRMVEMYRDQVRSLDALAGAESSWGTVLVLGDFNVGYAADARWQRRNLPYVRLTGRGLVAMWRDCGTDGKGTHGPQYIDQVWTDRPAVTCEVEYDIEHSDHYPVVGTYALDVLPVRR
jgi:endonuclease/exonuclease/phosphatase family metal-dependent hydrolase